MKVIYYISNKIGGVDIVWGLLELGIDTIKSDIIIDLENIVDDGYSVFDIPDFFTYTTGLCVDCNCFG